MGEGVRLIEIRRGNRCTSVGEIGRVFVVFVNGAWLGSVELGIFDFFEFDHFRER